MKHEKTISAYGSTLLCRAIKTAGKDRYLATIACYGGGGNDFGSGTVTIKVSPDGGTTLITAQKADGTDVTFTADGVQNVELGFGNSQEGMDIYAVMAGSTSPTVNVTIFDNAA